MYSKEGTNRVIIVNSIILYAKLLITSLCGFFTTRFALQALGVVDYGLFAVLGGIVALIDVANAVMINTTTRFMTVALGKGNIKEMNQQFNVNLRIHIITAIFSLIIALTIGSWYIFNYLNYEGDIRNALFVFFLSVIGADISMLGVPFHGLIIAKENFLVTSIPSVITAILKLIVSWTLIYFFSYKLIIFAGTQCLCAIFPVVIYALYCYRKYSSIVKISKISKKTRYKQVLVFSGWTFYGTAACMAKNQGAAIVINLFFSTMMNAALGVANTLYGLINVFAQNTSQPMFPQITKCYAAGNMNRCEQLLCITTKLSYLMILFVSFPFLIDAEWILGLWLSDVPPMAAKFTRLLLIDLLVCSFNTGIATVIKADGKIWAYEFFGNTLRLLAIIISFFILKKGGGAELLLYVYICCSIIVVLINQVILHRVTHINNMVLIHNSYIPSLSVTLLFVPIFFVNLNGHSTLKVLLAFIYLLLLVWFVGFNSNEKQYVRNKISLLFKMG